MPNYVTRHIKVQAIQLTQTVRTDTYIWKAGDYLVVYEDGRQECVSRDKFEATYQLDESSGYNPWAGIKPGARARNGVQLLADAGFRVEVADTKQAVANVPRITTCDANRTLTQPPKAA